MNVAKKIFYYTVLLGISFTGLLFIFFIVNFLLIGSENDPASFGVSIAEVNGTELGYRLRGTGSPSVIIFPGAFGSTADWEMVQALLERRGSVFVYDRPGYGISGEPNSPRTKDESALETMTLTRQLGIPPPYIILGDREGSAIALAFASLLGDSVTSILLINPPAHLDSIRAVAGQELFVRYFDPLPRLRTNALLAVFGMRRFVLGIPAEAPTLSEEGRRLLRHHYSRLTAYDAAADEIRINFSGSADPFGAQRFPEHATLIIAVSFPGILEDAEKGNRERVISAWREGASELKRRLPDAILIDVPIMTGSLHISAPGEIASLVDRYANRNLTAVTLHMQK